jgi:aminoglycoside 3'-phosphotransferase-2
MLHSIIPHELRPRLQGYDFSEELIGRSGDQAFRLEAPQRVPLFVKIIVSDADDRMQAEVERLRWLTGVGVPVPRILMTARGGADSHWLVMECLPGRNAAISDDSPETKVRAVAQALRDLHALDVAACPFDETLSVKMDRAHRNVQCGLVDEHDFDEEHLGRSAADLFQDLQRLRPLTEDIVVTHGDASLPNFMVSAGRFAGFVDCGRLGRSDRYQDLALACWSIRFNLGAEWIGPFLRYYGIEPADETRLYFYRLLDEFF